MAILLAAAASALVWYPQPVFDPFGWAVWGRELTDGGLDTSAGPSWKPLPVVVCALLAPLGDAMPEAWVVIARAGALWMLALCGGLAAALTPGGRLAKSAAASLAVAMALVIADSATPLARQAHGGLAEPLCAALFLLALERHLRGRESAAVLSLFLAGLMRPEALVLLALFSAGLWLSGPSGRRPAVLGAGLLGAAAVLWLVPDLVGAGDALTGADRARSDGGLEAGEGWDAVEQGLAGPLLAAWAGAAWAVWAGRRRDAGGPALVLVAALAWFAVVGTMTVVGYAGLARFTLPAAAAVCALGGAGLAAMCASGARWAAGRKWDPRGVAAAAGVALVVCVGAVQFAARASEVPDHFAKAEGRAEALAGAEPLVREVGRGEMLRCGAVDLTDPLARTAAAWALEVPIADVLPIYGTRDESGSGVVAVGPFADPEAVDGLVGGRRLGEARGWSAYAFACPETSPGSGAG